MCDIAKATLGFGAFRIGKKCNKSGSDIETRYILVAELYL